MALFTDAAVVTLDDLLPFESSLIDVASSHGINVETKISLALSAVGDKLMLWLLRAGASDPQHWIRRRLELSTVVVTSPLHRWLCFDALSRFFAEAYNVQLNTRFEGKWKQYQTEAANAESMVSLSGIGIVFQALPKPQMPAVSLGVGAVPAQSLFIQTAWTIGAGQEGALSPVNALNLESPSSVAVAMAEDPIHVPSGATGWNLYIGNTGDTVTRQNNGPLAIGSTWTIPSTGLVSGPLPLDGQQPDRYVIDPKRIQRG